MVLLWRQGQADRLMGIASKESRHYSSNGRKSAVAITGNCDHD